MRKSGILVLLLAMGLFTTHASFAQSKAEQMDKVITAYVANNQFMGSILVAQGDDIILNKGYGLANVEWNIPNSPTTKFRLASVTKQFTAASILLLEEQRKLKITDSVTKYFPNAPTAWRKITIFHLLNHSSGIPDFTGFAEFNTFELLPTTPLKTIQTFQDKALDFQPGEKVSYSSSGYIVLGALIEKVSGKSYEAFVQDNIFTPLKMNNSGYDSNAKIISQRATGYIPNVDGMINAGYSDMSVPFSAGALYSTTEDLLKWETALFDKKLLSSASLKKMITPYKENYALGLFVSNNNENTIIQHSGGIEGFNTQLTYHTDKKITVVVLANINSYAINEIANSLGDIAHGKKAQEVTSHKEITLPIDVLKKYLGAYELQTSIDMLITLEGNHLMSQLSHQNRGKVPLFAETDTRFFTKIFDAQIDFVEDEHHVVTHLVLHQNGSDKKALRR
jgi:CubicO group peptidase (beta-lactamase class C family)